jgi:putative endonuclease
MYWVYILENLTGKFYIGQTDDLATRLLNHNRTDKISGKFTRKNGPWKLVWSETHPDRASANQRPHHEGDFKMIRVFKFFEVIYK